MKSQPQDASAEARPHLVSETEYAFLAEGYRDLLPVPATLEPRMRRALLDTLAAPGSLARAQLAFGLLAPGRGGPFAARELAIALEYFHTASLLLDDLPCMDNARERRGRLCPHVVHGEAPAILAALALITQAYGLLWRTLSPLPARRRLRASALVQECLGAAGILEGQARDLAFASGPGDAAEVARVARGKTVTLIRLTLLLPALVAGATAPVLRRLEQLAESWGLAYQILDDFKDCLYDPAESGKTAQRDALLGRPNLVVASGVQTAALDLRRNLVAARAALGHLGALRVSALDRLQALLEHQAARVNERLAATA